MAILMTTLSKAPNGDWFARKAIPPDVRDAYQRAHGVRQEVRFRRAGLTEGQARLAFAEWMAEVEGRITALRSVVTGAPLELSHRQMHELAGRWYDWFIVQHSSDDTSVEVWDHHRERYEQALARFDNRLGTPDELAEETPRGQAEAAYIRATVMELSRLGTFLAGEGIQLATSSHENLVDTVEADLQAAMGHLRKRAGGNYRPDLHRERFPQAAPIVSSNVKLAGWNVWDAFAAWVNERKPAAATINRWRGVFLHLNKFLEERDIALVTDEDAVAWKDVLLSGKASGRTINEVWLTSAHRVFGWVKSQKKIAANPFEGVKVAVAKTGPTKGEFTEDDAEAILRATLLPRAPNTSPYQASATRWVPWLCAYTGSRSGEMTQLRKEDFEQHTAGYWLMHIRPEAGTVKGNVGRTVVLHDHLVEQGFIEFVRRSKAGPLFYDEAVAKAQVVTDATNPPRPMYVQSRQKIASWVRKMGIKDPGVGPNHGWRHTFKRRSARAKIERRIRFAFCGHTSNDVGDIYELPSIEDLAEAIRDFPRYPVETP